MEFLGNLGIDIKLLIAQIINFGVLVFVLTKFLYKPIIKRIEQDQKQLEESEIMAKELEEQKQDFEEYKQKELHEVKQRAQDIILEAEFISKQIKKRAFNESQKEKQAIIKQIKSRLKEINNE